MSNTLNSGITYTSEDVDRAKRLTATLEKALTARRQGNWNSFHKLNCEWDVLYTGLKDKFSTADITDMGFL